MSINITAPLKSRPSSIGPGQSAQLLLDLVTDQIPSETAQITYTANAPGVIFTASGTSVLQTSHVVSTIGSTSVTPYSLSGPPGLVSISVAVTPATPPAASGTSVVLRPALAVRGAALRPAGIPGAAARATGAAPTPGGPKKAAKATKKAVKKKAVKRKAVTKTAVRKKAATKKTATKARAGARKSGARAGGGARKTTARKASRTGKRVSARAGKRR